MICMLYVRAYIHTYTHTYIHTHMHAYIHAWVHTCMRTYMHAYIHACIHTYIHIHGKMADEVSQVIENALNKIVNTTDQSGNMKKELKKIILETVSTLRNLFTKMKEMCDKRTRQNKQLENEINTVKAELVSCRSAIATGHAETSGDREREQPRTVGRHVLLSHDRDRKLYSTVTAGYVEKKYKLMIR